MYEPDFVVQTAEGIFLVEVKDKAELGSEEVQDKARSAQEYCNQASAYTKRSGGRPWKYLLIPDDVVESNKDFKFFGNYEYSDSTGM